MKIEKLKIKILQQCKRYAINKNGLCLADEYVNSYNKILWQCSKAHQWQTTWNCIKNNNSWCPICAINKTKINISTLQAYAITNNLKLLSTEYINNNTKMLWECSEGHQWKATWNSIKHMKSRCPECTSYKTERLCKDILEEKLGFEFRKTRFYYNDQRFEFDGYNEKYKIAFEYHGYQHYEFPNKYHKTEEDFIMQIERDTMKIQYAIKEKIKLLIIPYTEENNLKTYIINLVENVKFIN